MDYLGKKHFAFLTTDWVLSQFGDRTAVARSRYARFVSAGLQERRRDDFHRGLGEARVIGADTFIERTMIEVGNKPLRPPAVERIISHVCCNLGMKDWSLAEPGHGRREAGARALIGWLAQQTGAASLTVVAQRFNRDISTLSRAVTALERKASAGGSQARALLRHKNAIVQA